MQQLNNSQVILTRKSCSETNTKAALRYRSTTIFKLFAQKKKLKWPADGHFVFF